MINEWTDFVNNFYLRSDNKNMDDLTLAMLTHTSAHPDNIHSILHQLHIIHRAQYL